MSTTYTEDVPLSIIDGSDGMLRVTFDYSLGRDAVGPAYDHGGLPAEPPEIEVTGAVYLSLDGKRLIGTCHLAPHEEERVIEWLFDHWEPPTGPDPDDERDRRRDEELTERKGG